MDIDADAFAHAAELYAQGVPSQNLIHNDFFAVTPSSMNGGRFDAVVGNPPYIRHHWLAGDVQERARRVTEEGGVKLPGQADAWAYFVLHALQFVRPGGRLTFLLPAAVMHADYAGGVLEWLVRTCSHVQLIRVGERIFPTAREETVVLAADGVHEGPGVLVLEEVESSADVAATLAPRKATRREVTTDTRRLWPLEQVPTSTRRAWTQALKHDSVRELGRLARIRIGVVTGANDFFLRTADEVSNLLGEGVRTVRVVSRARDLRTARLTADDIQRLDNSGRRTRLLVIDAATTCLTPALQRSVEEAEAQSLHLRHHTSQRDTWYALADTEVPDAFLPYMGSRPCRPVRNDVHATCTNGVHRLWWRTSHQPIAAAIVGSWTSLFAMGAEVYGRHYGGGVLKVEPSEAARIPVPVVSGAGKVLRSIDRLLRADNATEAQALADRVVLREGLGLSERAITAIQRGADLLASRRMTVMRP